MIVNMVLAYIAIPLTILSNVPLSSVGYAAAITPSVNITPIKHLVVIFQENISFDHYFGTYPHAANPPGQSTFRPSRNDTSIDINNLVTSGRLSENPNLVKPFRLDRSQPVTNDNNHTYTGEQKKYDGGKMARFVQENKVTPNYLAPVQCTNIEPGLYQNPRECFNPAQVMG